MRLLQNSTNIGLVGNWNRAIGEARGRLVKVMAHDDLLYPECVTRQVDTFKRHPDAVLVTCKRDIIDERGRRIVRGRGLAGLEGIRSAPDVIRAIVRAGGNPIGEGVAVMLDSDTARGNGPFSDALPYVVDLDFWARIVVQGNTVVIAETLCAFRVTSNSVSTGLARKQGSQVRSLLRHLRSEHPEWVTHTDAILGSIRAGIMRSLRGGLYRMLRLRRWLFDRDRT